ncbi:MAG: transporter substrate-binding domain-containing protein [Desulfovibrionaceae bacterium]
MAAPLRVAVEDDYYPFSFKQADGEQAGFDVDVSKALCALMQRPCELVPLAFNDIIPSAHAGRVEMVVAGLARIPEREKSLLYIDPYYRSRTVLLGKKGQRYPVVDATSMHGKRLAAQKGSVQYSFIINMLGKSAIVVGTPTVEDAFEAVINGEADIAFADSLAAMAFMVKIDTDELDYVADPLSGAHESGTAYIAVGFDKAELAAEVKTALSVLRGSDTFTRITQKYFPFSIY